MTWPAVKSTWLDKIIFLGTGTSSQVPAIHCITEKKAHCITCTDAMKPGSKNRRFCTSLVVVGSEPGQPNTSSTILIDCGKSFYESALRYFPTNGLSKIDAVLLTHPHADAILGLDDLRSWTMNGCIQNYVDIYLTQECMQTVAQTFPYLVDTSLATGGGDVGALRWHLIDASSPFLAGSRQVCVQPLFVEHGFVQNGRTPFGCLGFRIDTMSYISDCHYIPSETLDKVVGSDVFILDGLKMKRHKSHFSIPQAIACVLDLSIRHAQCNLPPPTLTLITDITHRLEHHETSAQLQRHMQGLAAWLFEHNIDAKSALPEWWKTIWDELENEEHERLRLSVSCTTDKSHPLVPSMDIAYDGAQICTSKRGL